MYSVWTLTALCLTVTTVFKYSLIETLFAKSGQPRPVNELKLCFLLTYKICTR